MRLGADWLYGIYRTAEQVDDGGLLQGHHEAQAGHHSTQAVSVAEAPSWLCHPHRRRHRLGLAAAGYGAIIMNLKGWKTILAGLAVAVLPEAMTYLSGVDWTKYVAPNTALMISGALMIGMRVITTTSIFKKA